MVPHAHLGGVAVYLITVGATYYYTVMFVQLGIPAIGREQAGLSSPALVGGLVLLAVLTLLVALVTGVMMDRRDWSTQSLLKVRVIAVILLIQLLVTAVTPTVTTGAQFLLWISICATVVGVGIPFVFSLLFDFVVPRYRGPAAGLAAGGAFALAALVPFEWTATAFRPAAIGVLTPVVGLVGLLAIAPAALRQIIPTGPQRTFQAQPSNRAPVFVLTVLLLFGAFFIDSLGFVRLLELPMYVETAWQSPAVDQRLLIAGTHLGSGLIGGLLFTRTGIRWLFPGVFGVFAVTQLLYAAGLVVALPAAIGTVLPLGYVTAVTWYTTAAFAVWAVVVTPETVGTRIAIGIGVGGWLATFLSTALALLAAQLQLAATLHLVIVGILSLMFLVATRTIVTMIDVSLR